MNCDIQRDSSPFVSVLIPVYKEPRVLRELLQSLTKDGYLNKEIIVVADEPSLDVINVLHEFKNKIKFKINEKRVGKVNALNMAINMSRGELLVFLDNDVIPCGNSFISKVVDEMQKADIGEIKKEVVIDSFISKMVYFDYLAYNYGNLRFSKDIGLCVGFNGAAFAIWRDAFKRLGGFRRGLAEDLDLATRSFLEGMSFRFINSVKVLNKAPSSFKEWIRQRRRWAIGIGVWLKRYRKGLIRLSDLKLTTTIISLLTLYPSSVLILPFMLFPIFVAQPFLISIIATSMMPLVLLSVFYYYFRKISLSLKFNIYFKNFVIYYFIYSPLWLIITIIGIVKGLMLKTAEINLEDWII